MKYGVFFIGISFLLVSATYTVDTTSDAIKGLMKSNDVLLDLQTTFTQNHADIKSKLQGMRDVLLSVGGPDGSLIQSKDLEKINSIIDYIEYLQQHRKIEKSYFG